MDIATAPTQDRKDFAIPAATRVYAIGDIHGRLDLLDRLLDKIAADSADAPARKVLVSLGDMVDRGPHSARVVERLMTLHQHPPFDGFEHHNLKGNHEQLMLAFLDGANDGAMWICNGGAATLESYGITDCWAEPDALRVEFNIRLSPDQRAFLRGLETQHREGDYLFVHAGIAPQTPLEAQSEDDLLWIRGRFLTCEKDLGVRVVHGHSSVHVPEILPNRIAIDTGAWESGALTCFVGQNESVKFITT